MRKNKRKLRKTPTGKKTISSFSFQKKFKKNKYIFIFRGKIKPPPIVVKSLFI